MTMHTAEQHGLKSHSDGGWDFSKPVQTRSERFSSTNVSDFPEVTGREPSWKFAPINKFRALFEDQLDGSKYNFEVTEASGVSTSWVARDSKSIGRIGVPEERASANAWTNFEEALHIEFSDESSKTVILTRSELGKTARAAHTVIEAKAHSQGLLILQNEGDANITENVEIIVNEGANLTVVSVQEWNDSAVHLSSHFATVGKDAKLTHIVVSLGGEVVRLNPSVHLDNEGSETDMFGAYFADAGQHIEQQVFMDHAAPNTKGRVTYKGALQGEGARTVWIGDVLIRRNASGTDSYEQNRNLVLSPGTRADSIPNLEIETGDIAGAGHASTTGRFDEEHIFYLQSRGISAAEARKLVVRGFLVEVIKQIGNEELEERLQSTIESELEQSGIA